MAQGFFYRDVIHSHRTFFQFTLSQVAENLIYIQTVPSSKLAKCQH